MWSKYLIQASDDSRISWNFLLVSSFCHLSQIDVHSLLTFEASRSTFLHCGNFPATKLRPCLQPLAVISDVWKHGAFKISEAAFIRRIISKSGHMCYPHRQRIVPFKKVVQARALPEPGMPEKCGSYHGSTKCGKIVSSAQKRAQTGVNKNATSLKFHFTLLDRLLRST